LIRPGGARAGRAPASAACLLITLVVLPAGAGAQISASPDPLDFGDVRVGNQRERSLTLQNDGVVAVTINSCAVDAPAGDFSVVSCPPSVGAGSQETVMVQFAPDVRGADTATLRITHSVALQETVTLEGAGVAPEMVVSVLPGPVGDPIDFGAALVDTPSATSFTFRVENQGDAPLDGELAESGANPVDWTYMPGATTFSLAAGEVRDIEATFTPRGPGGRSASVTFTDLDDLSTVPSVSYDLAGTGRAPSLEVDVAQLSFGGQAVGSQSAPQTATISNGGNADLTITSVAVPASNDEDWIISGFTGPTALGPGDSLEIDVVFAPQATGPQNAVLRIQSDSPVSPASIDVDLTGQGTGSASIGLSPTALTFGAIDVQTGLTAERTLTVSNLGNVPLTIEELYLEGLDGQPYTGGQYSLSQAAPFNIPASGDRAIDVVYAPVLESAGDYAVLVLETNAPDAPRVEVTMSGRGLDRHIAVSDPTLRFPDTYRNPIAPAAIELRVDNTGESPLRIDSVMLEGAGSFRLVGELPDQIAPLGSATVSVLFAPTMTGDIHGELLLVNDDDGRPRFRIDLDGTGVLPPIAPSFDEVDFGSATLGLEVGTPGDGILTLVNRSEVDSFTIQGFQVTDAEGRVLEGGYRVVGLPRPVALGPGDALRVELLFQPERGGDFSGTLEVLVDQDPLGIPLVTLSALAVDGSLHGGGCRAGGGAGWSAALLLLVLLLGRRRPTGSSPVMRCRIREETFRWGSAALVVLAALSGTASAQVEERQTRNLDLATFRPTHGIEPAMMTIESSRVAESGSFSFDVWLDHARNPLVVETAGGEMVDRPISGRTSIELAGAYAFADRFEVCAAVPLLTQGGSDPQFSGIAPAEGGAIGDVRVRGRAFLYQIRPLSFGASGEVSLPTSTDEEFAGAGGPSAAVRLLADYRQGPLDLALNAGGVMRQKAMLADVEQGHQVLYGVGAAYRATRSASAIAELFGAVDLGGGPAGGKPLEAVLGGRYRLSRTLAVTGGLGRGLLPGIGSPDLRVFVSLAFAPRAQLPVASEEERLALLDLDGDRVPARDDRCPDEAEDRDGFADGDGCPDPDDDGDGVPDLVDRCPRQAEDLDRHQDADGCPDPDNDGDSIADSADRCPDAAEDADGFADDDGCPDPDNDRDGVPDDQDRCNGEPETINGNADDDGCPDKGETLVMVTKDRLELFEPIRFKGESAELTVASVRLLGQVGATLRANGDIARLRIRAHVDKRARDGDQLSVRRAEAVRRWLVEWGISADRLEGVGFGSRFPLGRARGLNDRIELEIAERRTSP
jgi:outer membrane protein OmpA-like peptidoglycan-associated protein